MTRHLKAQHLRRHDSFVCRLTPRPWNRRLSDQTNLAAERWLCHEVPNGFTHRRLEQTSSRRILTCLPLRIRDVREDHSDSTPESFQLREKLGGCGQMSLGIDATCHVPSRVFTKGKMSSVLGSRVKNAHPCGIHVEKDSCLRAVTEWGWPVISDGRYKQRQ